MHSKVLIYVNKCFNLTLLMISLLTKIMKHTFKSALLNVRTPLISLLTRRWPCEGTMPPHDLEKGCFGVVPLHVAPHPHNCISNNGLPITHNSIRLIGRFADLAVLDHPNICKYLDIIRFADLFINAVTFFNGREA